MSNIRIYTVTDFMVFRKRCPKFVLSKMHGITGYHESVLDLKHLFEG